MNDWELALSACVLLLAVEAFVLLLVWYVGGVL